MNELISVIIPVYNMGDYLRRCVASVLDQTYRELEIILVDDGSTDDSAEICDELKRKDDRIIVIHKPNGGTSDARNRGIDEARGKYIGFVDGDDYIDENMFSNLYGGMEKYNADIAVCGTCRKSPQKVEMRSCGNDFNVLSRQEAYSALFKGKYGGSSCDKLFKAELFEKVRYRMLRQGEDLDLFVRSLKYAERLVTVPFVGYYAVYREGSSSNSIFDDKRMEIIRVWEEMIETVQEICPDVLQQAYAYELKGLNNSIEYMYKCRNRSYFLSKKKYEDYLDAIKGYRKYFTDILKKNLKFYIGNPNVKPEDYILLWGFLCHIYRPIHFLLLQSVNVYHFFR